jgi:hypothetical protein
MGWNYVSELRPSTGILFTPHMIWVRRATVEWYWQGKAEELGEKLPVSLCTPLNSHVLTRKRTRDSAVTGRRLPSKVSREDQHWQWHYNPLFFTRYINKSYANKVTSVRTTYCWWLSITTQKHCSVCFSVRLKYLFVWRGFISIFATIGPEFVVSVYSTARYTFHIDFDRPGLSVDLYRRGL